MDANSRFDVVRNVEEYDPRFELADTLNQSQRGAPVVNLNNEVVGISLGDNTVLNATYIQFQLRSLLRNEALTRPFVGISYIPVADMHGYDGADKGIVISRSATRAAVLQSSPLAGQLEEGDVITAVEGITVNDMMDFAHLIYDYKIGDTVTLSVIVDGQQQELELTIQEQE